MGPIIHMEAYLSYPRAGRTVTWMVETVRSSDPSNLDSNHIAEATSVGQTGQSYTPTWRERKRGAVCLIVVTPQALWTNVR